MAIEHPGLPRRNAYGRLIRERGTRRIVLAAVALFVLWYAYSTIRVIQMQAVKWPPLAPAAKGLTVLGLQDRDRPGFRHMYEAYEVSHAWQIRIRDDAEPEDIAEVDAASGSDETPHRALGQMKSGGASSEGGDREVPPSVQNRESSAGRVVPVSVLMKTCPTVLLGSSFTDADVETRYDTFRQKDYYVVHVGLTPEGRSRYWQYSRGRDKERLAFVVDGQVITCAQMVHMDVSSLDIDPIWVKEDANQLANVINRKG